MAEPVRRHRQPVRRSANAPASRRRADPASPRGVKPSAADALRLARRRFLACQRIDTPRVDPDVLAYAIVRIGEAFLYNDAIIALEPNVEQACAVVRLLLD